MKMKNSFNEKFNRFMIIILCLICLQTHEEAITHLLAGLPPLSYKHLPLLLYQITNKYRDEMKPRCGLIRSREFLMKDLYSFDVDESSARETYNTVLDAYKKLFEELGVSFSVGKFQFSLQHLMCDQI